jgi:tRNA-splicing ligase RtcB
MPCGRPWLARLPRITENTRSSRSNNRLHLGTLGTGNHFIEVCLDEADGVWFMLHSGSRGVGNAIGSLFIELAQADMRQHLANLPDRDLAYFTEGSRISTTTWRRSAGPRTTPAATGR